MTENRDKLWTRVFIMLLIVNICTSVSSYAQNNGVPIYVSQRGGSSMLSGSMTTFLIFGGSIGRLIAGRLADSSGRRRVMLAGLLGHLVFLVLPMLFTSIQALMVFRFLQGFMISGTTTAAPAAAADILPKSRLGEGLGYFGLGQSFGLVVGPALGLALINSGGGHLALFSGSAVIISLCAVLIWRSKYEEAPPPQPEKRSNGKAFPLIGLFEKNAVGPGLAFGVFSLASAVTITFLSLYCNSIGTSPTPFFMAQALGLLITRIAVGRYIDRHRPVLAMIPASISGILGFLFLALFHNPILFFVSGFLYGMSLGITAPLLQTVAVKRSPRSRYGATNATFNIFCELGIGLGSLLWGQLVDATGSYMPIFYGAAASILLGGGVLGYVFIRHDRPTAEF